MWTQAKRSGTSLMSMSEFPLRYDVEVPPDGRVEVRLPLPAGSHVTVLVYDAADSNLPDLAAAALSSTGFWDNPEDDEDWNDA
jgi:hypothetical protein